MEQVITTVRLPNDLHEALRRRAFEERRPMTDLIREAVRRLLESRIDDGSPVPPVVDPFFKVIGTVGGGDRDESTEHDHYLYRSPRKRKQRRR